MDAHVIVNLFHVLLVAPLFIWVGIAKSSIPFYVFNFVLILGIIVTLYHAYKTFIRFQKNSGLIWINLIHVLIVGPLLIYVGANKKDTPRWAYELLLLTGFAALGYHVYEMLAYSDLT